MKTKASSKKKTEKKIRKKISARYLENAGVHYLNRYASSVENFRQVMMRKIQKSCADHPDQDKDECVTLLNQTIQKFYDLGYLNDDIYAKQYIRGLLIQGKSPRAITQKLIEKSLDPQKYSQLITQSISADFLADCPHDLDFLAALRLCKKKRIGPFNPDETKRRDNFEKDLGKLARSGCSYQSARQAIEFDYEHALALIEDYNRAIL